MSGFHTFHAKVLIINVIIYNSFMVAIGRDFQEHSGINFIPVNVDLDETVSYFMDRNPEEGDEGGMEVIDLPQFQLQAQIFGVGNENQSLPYCFSTKAHIMLDCKVTVLGSFCGKKAAELDTQICKTSKFYNQMQYCIPSDENSVTNGLPARFITCRRFAQRLIAHADLNMYIKYANIFVRVCCNPEASLRYIRVLPKLTISDTDSDADHFIKTNAIDNESSGYFLDDGSAGRIPDMNFKWNINFDDIKPSESVLDNKKLLEIENEKRDTEAKLADPEATYQTPEKNSSVVNKVIRKCSRTESKSWVCRWTSRVQ